MKFIFLTQQFYDDYSHCPEILQKLMRPYVQVYTVINGVQFAIPLRSGITHSKHVLWTDKEKGYGLDFSKAVVIADDAYINKSKKPYVRQSEFDSLRGKEYIIKQKMLKYIADYKKAKSKQCIERNRTLCRYSTLQYFEEYIFD